MNIILFIIIFKAMTARTYIFSAGFVFIFAALHVQPLFIHYTGIKKEVACPKMVKPSCSKTKCSNQKQAEEKKDCNSNKGCNPFLPCSIGICCYLVENPFSYSATLIIAKQKIAVINDNRIQRSLSECWHPPEVLS